MPTKTHELQRKTKIVGKNQKWLTKNEKIQKSDHFAD